MQTFISVRGLNLRGARAAVGVSPCPTDAPRASFSAFAGVLVLAGVGTFFGVWVFVGILIEEGRSPRGDAPLAYNSDVSGFVQTLRRDSLRSEGAR